MLYWTICIICLHDSCIEIIVSVLLLTFDITFEDSYELFYIYVLPSTKKRKPIWVNMYIIMQYVSICGWQH